MKKILLSLSVFFGVLTFFPALNNAEGNSLTVSPVTHEAAIDKEDPSSFSLKVKPGEEYTLEVDIRNAGKEQTAADIFVNDAVTTSQGVISYGTDKDDGDFPKSLDNPISKITKASDKKVDLKPGETKRVSFKVTMPKEEFKGIKLGGIYVLNAVSDSEKDKMFKNRFSYTVPVMLTESDEQIKPNVEFVSLNNTQKNKRNYLEIKLENTEKNILSRGIFTLELFKGDKKIAEQSKEEMSIAPNSYLPYRMQWGDNNVVPGKYTAKFGFDTPWGQWKWEEDFEINRKEAKKLNDSAIHAENPFNIWPYIIAGLVLVALVAGGFYVYKKKKK